MTDDEAVAAQVNALKELAAVQKAQGADRITRDDYLRNYALNAAANLHIQRKGDIDANDILVLADEFYAWFKRNDIRH